MGAPKPDNLGLSFKEKLQRAIAESNENDRNDVTSSTQENSRRHFQGLSSIGLGFEAETDDALLSNLRMNSICLLEKVAELLLLEREKAVIASADSENYRKRCEAKDLEIETLKEGLEAKSKAEKKLTEENTSLKSRCEELKARCNRQRSPHPPQKDQGIQVSITLSPPRVHPQGQLLRKSTSTSTATPVPRSHSINHVISGSGNRSRQQYNQALRSDSPPQLSPAIAPRHSSRSNTNKSLSADDEERDLDLDLEVPPSASKLPAKRSMSPYAMSPHKGQTDRDSEGTLATSPKTRVYPGAISRNLFSRNSPDHKSYSNREGTGNLYILPNGDDENYEEDQRSTNMTSSSSRHRDVYDLVPINQDFVSSSTGGHSNERKRLELPFRYPRNLASIGIRNQQRTLSKTQQSSQHRRHFSKHNFLDLGSLKQNKTVPSPLPTVPVTKVKEPKLSKAPTDTTNITNNPVLTNPKATSISPIKAVVTSKRKTTAEKCMVANPRLNCMTTKSPYLVNECEDTMSGRQAQEEEEEELGKNVEVPAWRIKIFEPLIRPENDVEIEDLSEQAFLKRHQRLEIDEKRRKRWDSQRVREETYVEKLKRKRQEREREKINRRKAAGRRVAAGGGDRGESDEEMDFERPTFDDVMYIRVSDEIPISVFGSLLPISEQSTFQIPWKTELEQEKIRSVVNSSVPPDPLQLGSVDEASCPSPGHDASSSSSVSSLPSLPSPTVVPHLRKTSTETNSNPSQIVIAGGGGYSIISISSSSTSRSSGIEEIGRIENPPLESEPTCPSLPSFAMSAVPGNPQPQNDNNPISSNDKTSICQVDYAESTLLKR